MEQSSGGIGSVIEWQHGIASSANAATPYSGFWIFSKEQSTSYSVVLVFNILYLIDQIFLKLLKIELMMKI